MAQRCCNTLPSRKFGLQCLQIGTCCSRGSVVPLGISPQIFYRGDTEIALPTDAD